jgi:hypothetical protein
MTQREWNKAISLMTQVEMLRMSLDHDDPAREFLYEAEMALDKVLRCTVPAR